MNRLTRREAIRLLKRQDGAEKESTPPKRRAGALAELKRRLARNCSGCCAGGDPLSAWSGAGGMVRTTCGIGLLALAVTACGEKPQRAEHQEKGEEKEKASSALARGAGDPMRERTVLQDETGRIYR
ncbi:MAG TPA: hypothetical protein VFZ54_08140 [Burkholderiales bacterium]